MAVKKNCVETRKKDEYSTISQVVITTKPAHDEPARSHSAERGITDFIDEIHCTWYQTKMLKWGKPT